MENEQPKESGVKKLLEKGRKLATRLHLGDNPRRRQRSHTQPTRCPQVGLYATEKGLSRKATVDVVDKALEARFLELPPACPGEDEAFDAQSNAVWYLYVTKRLQSGEGTPRIRAHMKAIQRATLKAKVRQSHDSYREGAILARQLHGEAFLTRNLSAAELALKQKVEQLRRLQLFVDYGDLCAKTLSVFRQDTRSAFGSMNEFARGDVFWSDLDEKLVKEEADLKVWKRTGAFEESKPPTPMTNMLHLVCIRLGESYHTIRETIALYSERNNTFHNGLQPLIENCQWPKLGVKLAEEIKALQSKSFSHPGQHLVIESALLRLVGQYFDNISEFETLVVPNKYAVDLANDRSERMRKEIAQNDEHRKEQARLRSEHELQCQAKAQAHKELHQAAVAAKRAEQAQERAKEEIDYDGSLSFVEDVQNADQFVDRWAVDHP